MNKFLKKEDKNSDFQEDTSSNYEDLLSQELDSYFQDISDQDIARYLEDWSDRRMLLDSTWALA